jgi:hypothetical protein
MKKDELPPEALEFFRKHGARGGKIGGSKAWENLTPAERSARAKKAAKKGCRGALEEGGGEEEIGN